METKQELREKIKVLEGRNVLLDEFINELLENVPEARSYLDNKILKAKELLKLGSVKYPEAN